MSIKVNGHRFDWVENETVKQLIDNNRGEFEFVVNLTIDSAMRDIKKSNDTPLKTRKFPVKDDSGELLTDRRGQPIETNVESKLIV